MTDPNPLNPDGVEKPTIIVVGRTGAGKSTLINTLFGKEVAKVGKVSDVTTEVKRYTIPITGVNIIDTPGSGGMSTDCTAAMRDYLNLDRERTDKNRIPADMILFVFSHERRIPQEYEFFQDIESVYFHRLIAVKNTSSDETSSETQANLDEIQSKTGRLTVPVNARTGQFIEFLIDDIFRLLSPAKLASFNASLQERKEKARYLAKLYTVKTASLVAVIRRKDPEVMREMILRYKDELKDLIQRAYLDSKVNPDLDRVISNSSTYGHAEDNSGERTLSAVIGGGLGMLLGILAGPLGVGILGALGAFLGSALPDKVLRGGEPAVINVFSQGYGLAIIIETALTDPGMVLAGSKTQMERWLASNQNLVLGLLEKAERETSYQIRASALTQFLNNPNVTDPSLVETRLRSIADQIFDNGDGPYCTIDDLTRKGG